MRGLVVFSALAMIIALSFTAVALSKGNKQAGPFEPVKFSTFTSAVCEDSRHSVRCEDRLFVNCNGKVSHAGDTIECSGIKLDSPKVTGFAVFGKDWKDPRV